MSKYDRTWGDYEKDLESSREFQDFVMAELYKVGIPLMVFGSMKFQNVGESINGIEIKHDKQFRKTGNFYFTVATKPTSDPNVEYHDCGLTKDDNTWLYLIGDYNDLYIFSKSQLQYVYKMNKYNVIEIKAGTNKGMLLPMKDALKFYCIKHIKCNVSL